MHVHTAIVQEMMFLAAQLRTRRHLAGIKDKEGRR